TLFHDPTKSPRFVLLKPIYTTGMPLLSVADRRAAFRGWVYAPFVGARLLDHLTARQDTYLHVRIYDGTKATPTNLIASNGPPQRFKASFASEQIISVPGRQWLVAWQSTPAFEAALSNGGAASMLYGGLGMTLMLTVFLLSRRGREDRIRETVTLRTGELTQQVKQNASIINSAVVTIALLDQNGNILSINSALERLFETTSAEVLGKPFSSLVCGQMAEYFARSDESSEVFNYRGEIEVVLKSGVWIALDVGVNAWTTEEGLLRYTVVMRDITDRRRIENQLRETQHRLEVALTGAQIGVFDIDPHSGQSIVSATWKLLMGLDPDQEVDAQREWESRVHPDDKQMIADADKACIEGRTERATTEYRVKSSDGSWRWMRSNAVAVERDASGVALRLVGIQTDITERVKDKEDLRASEAQFRSAIEDAPVGMAIIDMNGRFLQVNQSLAYFAGVSQSQLMTASFLRMTHPDDRGAVMKEVGRLIAGEAKSFHKETRYIDSNGTVIWGLLSVAIVRDSRDGPRSFLVQVQDLTEMRKADLVKRQFVSTISHELRTPLTSINGSVSLVLNAMRGEVSEKARRLLSIAQTNCDRLILLVNDILDIEKNAAGELHFYPEPANVTKLVQDAVTANAPFGVKYDVTYDVCAPEDTMGVCVDVNRFQQVMTNLLSNAAKFSNRGSQVKIAVGRVAAGVSISVTNQGTGITPDFRAKAFAPFSQQDSSETRANGGTGLGLHICRLIVERMGGTIGFDSVPNQSTTFWFTLPADGMDNPALPPSDQPSEIHQY
ncbi:MAG: PAS domain S-box protein, partial [Paracoccaceae bacterium]|nr:PAS domain S-box protein [Paracoccaceae bacterium]